MEDFKLDLQLFADGDTAPVEQAAPEQPVMDSGNVEGNEPSDASEQNDWEINQETGDITFNPAIFGFDDDDSTGGAPAQAEQPTQQQQEQPQEQLYTVNVNGVEQQVSLDDLKKGYMMQSDYTRKTQQLAEERRQIEAAQAQYQQQAQQQRPVQQQPAQHQQAAPQVNPKEYYQTLSNYAVKRVSENLGEDFDEYNPVHQAALADEISTIKAAMYERNIKQQEIQQVYNKYAQDPNIQAIDQYAAQRLQQLPYGQAVKIQQALRNNDARVIDAYMAAARDEFYRKQGYVPRSEAQYRAAVPPQATPPQPVRQQKQNPPFAESSSPAKTNQGTSMKTLDYSAIGKLTLDQQAALASKLGLG